MGPGGISAAGAQTTTGGELKCGLSCLTPEALGLLIPPLHLSAAAVWYTVQKRQTKHYGNAVEFLEIVNESAPELVSFRHYAKLTLGLKAKIIMEMFIRDALSVEILQALDRYFPESAPIHPQATKRDAVKVGEAQKTFRKMVKQLVEDRHYREQYLQEEMQEEYGDAFFAALEKLLWEYMVRLDSTVPKLPVQQLLETVSSIKPSSPAEEKMVSHLVKQPSLQSLQILFQYFRDLGHLQTPDVVLEEEEKGLGEDFQVVFPANRRQDNASDADSELSDSSLDDRCLSANIKRENIERWTGKSTPLWKELQLRSLMSQRIEKTLSLDSEDAFHLILEIPTEPEAASASDFTNQLETEKCVGSSELEEQSKEGLENEAFPLTPLSCDTFCDKELAFIQSCSPAFAVMKGRDQSEFRTPVPKGKRAFSTEEVARVLMGRSDEESVPEESPVTRRKKVERAHVNDKFKRKLLESCLKYQPKVLLYSLDNISQKKPSAVSWKHPELSRSDSQRTRRHPESSRADSQRKRRRPELSRTDSQKTIRASSRLHHQADGMASWEEKQKASNHVPTLLSSSKAPSEEEDHLKHSKLSGSSNALQRSSPEFKVQGRESGRCSATIGTQFTHILEHRAKPQRLLKRLIQQEQLEQKENVNGLHVNNPPRVGLPEAVRLQVSFEQDPDPPHPAPSYPQSCNLLGISDVILDSEDEDFGGQLRTRSRQVSLKHYHRTKFNTFIPTLVEHLKPEGVKPCYIPLYKGHITTLMEQLKSKGLKPAEHLKLMRLKPAEHLKSMVLKPAEHLKSMALKPCYVPLYKVQVNPLI